MAQFNIKRGDSMPPAVISARIAGTDPERYWTVADDDVGSNGENNGVASGTPTVKFIMKNLSTGKIVGQPANVALGFTGYGEIKTVNIDGQWLDEAQTIPAKKTLLRYNWQPPADTFNPVSNPTAFGGDTFLAGSYTGEFEVEYANILADFKKRKRTFPATSGDIFQIEILADLND